VVVRAGGVWTSKHADVRHATGGFDLSAFDRAVEGHQGQLDVPCSIWQYEHTTCTEPFTVANFDFTVRTTPPSRAPRPPVWRTTPLCLCAMPSSRAPYFIRNQCSLLTSPKTT
jgi:hypothetical protein